MKKIYVMAVFLGASTFAFNQANQEVGQDRALKQATDIVAVPFNHANADKKGLENNYSEKALGTEFFTSDFSDPTAWTIGGSGNQGAWVIGDVDSPDAPSYSLGGQPFIVPMKTVAGDNFAWFDGVQFVIDELYEDQNAWIQLAAPLDLSSENVIAFRFNQSYMAYNYDNTFIDMSLDGGTTWTSTQLNSSVGTMTSSEDLSFDLRFTVNGSNNVLFRFRIQSDLDLTDNIGFNGSMAWQIDDVVIAGLPDNDLQSMGRYIKGASTDTLVYYQIPLKQVSAINGSGAIRNVGSNDQTNVKFKAVEASAGYTSESDPTDILVGQTKTLLLNTAFTPSAKGNYKIDYSVEADDADDAPSNNVFKSYEFVVGDSVYARDNSTQAENGVVYNDLPTYGISGKKISQYAVYYEIHQSTKLTSVSFQFGDRITEGEMVQVKLLDETADNLVAEGAFYTMQAGDEGSFHTLNFNPPVNLTAETAYYASVEVFSDSMSIASSTGTPAQYGTSLFKTADGWSNLSPVNVTYVIRMNVNGTVSVENNELSSLNVTQFPNPFANETTVRFSLEEASNVSYTITDMAGKVIADVNEGNLTTGNHEITVNGSSLANGIYYFNLKTDNAQVTRKMVVNK